VLTEPALMEGIERTNVVVRNLGGKWDHQEEILMQWMWIEEGIVTIVEDLDIWLGIVGIEERRLEYGNRRMIEEEDGQNNLNRNRDLIVLD